jgi:hypothetical protein
MGVIPEQDGNTDLVERVARAIGRHKTNSGQCAAGTSPVSNRK